MNIKDVNQVTFLAIKASDIDNWTSKEPRRAQELLPKLIWKLILASSKTIEDHHFPFEKAVQYAGYDGYLVTTDTSSFYPNGTSVWEFGTDEDIKSKFNSDYKKRSDDPGGIDSSNTTFCFVTSRIWNHREGITEFTKAKQEEAIWKSVRIFDANNLEMWLSECPSVAAWFSKIIEKPFDDIMSLQDYWDYVVDKTEPKLTSEFFCYGRDKSIADEIIQNVDGGCSQIILSAESKIEAILTLTADLLRDTNLQKEQFLSKAVVALSSEGLNNICRNYKNAIIIPAFKNESVPVINNNFLIFPTENKGPIDLLYKNSPKSKVEPRRRKIFTEALKNLGYDTNESDRISGDVKCRFSPLFRKITTDIQFKLPSWASDTDISNLIPALFANAWEENLEGDKIALEILSGQKYNDYISTISAYTQGDNMPTFRLDHSFACISINELWDVLAQRINKEFFENYKKCINYVFAEVDPRYELPEEKWNAASVYGKKSKFSERLKRGLIISMTKLIELDEKEGFFNFTTSCTRECNNLVLEIYNGLKSANQWRTLVPYVSDFVEASPEAILNIIESNVAQDSDIFWGLFESSGNPLFGRTFYTHILWALEKLVWIKEYCVRAINLLITLDEKNFEYKISNCPMDSLLKIFCLWHPQGALSIDERDILLSSIMDKHHTVGRKLVKKLLPNGMTTTTNLAEFSWRYVEYYNPEITNVQYWNSVKCMANKFVQTMGANYEDWRIIIKHFSVFYNIFKELGVDIVQKGLLLSESNRLKLCTKMATSIGRERKFLDEGDTDNENLIDEMENIYNSLLPNSPLRYAHYYSYNFYGFNPEVFRAGDYDYNKEKETLQKLRMEALEETLDKFELDSVLPLAQNVAELKFLIDSLIESKYFESINVDFIIKAHLVFPEFAERLINSIYYAKGIAFFADKLEGLSNDDIKWIVSQLPITPDVIQFINSFPEDIENEFWQCANTWGIMHYDSTFARECINTLIKSCRPYSAIRELYFADDLYVDLILDVLQATLDYHPNTERNGINLNNIDGHFIENLFGKIYKSPSPELMRVSQLELAYMNKFSMDFEPECLVKNALSNPHVFIKLVSYCFKKDEDIGEETTEDKQYIAHLSFKALDKIKQLPGQENEIVDVDKFNLWIQSVLVLAKELKYVTACDIQIGKILSYSPVDEDGVWPHKCVRDFLEKNTSETINDHMCIGVFNQRGVHTVTGGDEEEQFAATYNEYAQKLQLLYPKTAYIVKEISDRYKCESRFERARELKGYF